MKNCVVHIKEKHAMPFLKDLPAGRIRNQSLHPCPYTTPPKQP